MSRTSNRGRLCIAFIVAFCAACRSLREAEAPSPNAEIVGNEHVGEAELCTLVADELLDFERSGFRKAPIDDAAFLMEEHYRSLGFAFATVEYELVAEGRRARFLVSEGQRVRLASFEVTGASTLPRDEIRMVIEARLGEAGDAFYSASRADAAAEDLRRHYRRLGFLDVQVSVEPPSFDADRSSATLSLRVVEGLALQLESVEWLGDPALPRVELDELADAFLGQPYTPRLREAVRRRAVDELRERGHPDAEVEIVRSTRTEAGGVRLELRPRPGPAVFIEEVRILGNERTKSKTILGRMRLEPGPYRATQVREATQRLYAMGLFSKVDVRLEPDGSERRTLVVRLEERPSAEVYVEPGFGSYELGRVRAGLVDRNLLGSARTVRAEGAVSFKSVELELGATDAALLGTDDVLSAAVAFERREEPSFEFQDIGLDLAWTRRWSERFTTRIAYELRRSELLDDDVTLSLTDTERDFDQSSIELSPTYDARDGILDPTRGFLARVSLEIASEALGSEVDFVRGTWSHAHYVSLDERTVLAARGRVGVVAPIGPTDSIPLQERFFLGGESSVRSYRESELGPTDADGDPSGGEAFSLASVELRRRLSGRFEGAVFVDGGHVAPRRTDLLDFEDYGLGVGLGLRYVLPVGPIRLDVAVNPSAEDGEDEVVLHLAVGRAF